MKEQPLILWLADTPGWAYDSIIRQNTKRLCYSHAVYYMMNPIMRGSTFQIVPKHLAEFLNKANVVVSMYLHYHEICEKKENIVLMLTGMRPFE